MLLVGYFILLLVVIIVAIFLVYMVLEIWGDIQGAPYVPSGNRDIDKLLEVVKIKPGATVIELGCGSGRFLRAAAVKYKVFGIGVDVNLVLVLWARLSCWVGKIKNLDFRCQDMFEQDLSGADVVYLFLLPRALQKLDQKLKKEAKKGTLVISHGFELVGWNYSLVTRIPNHVFDTFVYRV